MDPHPPYIPPPPDVYQTTPRPPGGGLHFTVSEVISKGFSVYFKNLPAFLLMSVIGYAPLIVYALVAPVPSFEGLDDTDAFWKLMQFAAIVSLGGILCDMLVASAVTYATVQELSGHHVGIGASLRVGLSRMLPTLLVSLLAGLCVVLGLVLLIIPGLILLCMFYVAIPASVIERPGIGGALGRSAALTKGYRWRILGLIVLMWILSAIISSPIDSALVEKDDDDLPINWKLSMLVDVGTSLLLGGIQATIVAATYVGLRNDKEGVGVEELARVFE